MREEERRGDGMRMSWECAGRGLTYTHLLRIDREWGSVCVCGGSGMPTDAMLDMPVLAEVPRTDR